MSADDYNEAELKAGNITPAIITALTSIAQREFGLLDDGKCGPDTRAKLAPKPAALVIPQYNDEFWRPYIAKYTTGKLIDFAVKWVGEESGGNPCAIGSPNAKGPDGYPQEMGIAQFYNPDDIIRLKLSSAGLRAYCTGNQKVSRPLTAQELDDQANATVKLMNECIHSATADLAKVGASWGDTRDFYCAVKLQHGLPGISRSGFPAVAKYLGRAPRSWSEFRDTVAHVKLDSGTERYRSEFPRIFANAEETASVIL